tara:strand:+ start:323 stop:439 length:117 start_codon:yes stop_codon:yes gene_type:complete
MGPQLAKNNKIITVIKRTKDLYKFLLSITSIFDNKIKG